LLGAEHEAITVIEAAATETTPPILRRLGATGGKSDKNERERNERMISPRANFSRSHARARGVQTETRAGARVGVTRRGSHLVLAFPRGMMGSAVQGRDLLRWLASLPPSARDAAVERCLGIDRGPSSTPSPGDHLHGYHPSGVAPIVRMLLDVPVVADDVVVDLGAGLGKVVLLTRLLTGAAVRGIELQPELVGRARDAAARLGANASFILGDARDARQVDLDDATVFFLYLPFTGPVLAEVMLRLKTVASRRSIVVATLGVDVDREAPWLVRRPSDTFWLAIYDSVLPGVAARAPSASPVALQARREAEVVAFELADELPGSRGMPLACVQALEVQTHGRESDRYGAESADFRGGREGGGVDG
jgi:hypothetical protein